MNVANMEKSFIEAIKNEIDRQASFIVDNALKSADDVYARERAKFKAELIARYLPTSFEFVRDAVDEQLQVRIMWKETTVDKKEPK